METLSFSQLSVIVGLCLAVFTVLNMLLGWGERLWGKKKEDAPTQSAACNLQHTSIANLIATQNANIAELLKQNGAMLSALTQSTHSAELRHQIVINRFDRLQDQLEFGTRPRRAHPPGEDQAA